MTPMPVPDGAAPVLVFGEALFDDFGSVRVAGGAPYNLARHLAGFGHAPWLLTRIGDDPSGQELLAEMQRRGMPADGVQTDAQAATGRVVVTQDSQGHSFRIEPASAWDAIAATPQALALAGRAPWLCFGTLALRGQVSHATWQALCRAHTGRRFLDFNWREGHLSRERALQAIAQCDVMKLSDAELHMLLDWHGMPGTGPIAPGGPGEISASVTRLLAPYGVRQLVVTFGAAGYACYDHHGRCQHTGSAVAGVAVVDTVGAGDAFSSVVLLGLLCGWEMALTLARANDFAAAICGIRGAVPEDTAAYLPWRRRWQLDGQPA